VLELFVVTFGWTFNPAYPVHNLQVIWAIGISMIALSVIIYMDRRFILLTGLVLVGLHNLLDGIHAASFGKFYWLWIFLHSPASIPVTAHFSLSTRYVLFPWVGVMAAGFAFGALLQRPDRRKWILTVGISATALFFVLRGINFYGNGIVETASRYANSAGP